MALAANDDRSLRPPNGARAPGAVSPIGVLLVSLCGLFWEVLLARLLGVYIYHVYAFVVVSLAMFGLTLGSLFFFSVAPASNVDVRPWLSGSTLLAGLAMAASTISLLEWPPRPGANQIAVWLVGALPLIPIGFFFSTVFSTSRRMGRLYAYDLIGAGLGCTLMAIVVPLIGAPGAMFAAAGLCLVASGLLTGFRRRGRRIAWVGLAAILAASGMGFRGAFRLKRLAERSVDAEDAQIWNAFSLVTLSPAGDTPFGWGIAPDILNAAPKIEQKVVQIDVGAESVMTRFTGDTGPLDYLKADVTAIAHHLRSGASVFVIGAGGGRDVLTGLVFGQRRIVAAEVNPAIPRLVNRTFGDFTGHLDQRPGVEFVTDEARSYLRRLPERFDIIQAALVDTWAATAAGAYALVENSLYTVEAWENFFDRLSPHGILSVSRWFDPNGVEFTRTVHLATAALRRRGVSAPENHLIAVRSATKRPVFTLLVSPDPFSADDIDRVRRAADAAKEVILYVPGQREGDAAAVILGLNPDTGTEQLDLSAPTDNRPFFFFYGRPRDLFRTVGFWLRGQPAPSTDLSLISSVLASALFWAAVLLAVSWIVLRTRGSGEAPQMNATAYFAAIGLGFMLVEMPMLHQMALFLGHPVYGFTVVLFGILVGAGLGAVYAELAADRDRPGVSAPLLLGSLAFYVAVGWLVLPWAARFAAALRIAVALIAVFVPAFQLGRALPAGLRLAESASVGVRNWYWAVNGAFSVVGSAAASVCVVLFGIRFALLAGMACYSAAFGTGAVRRAVARTGAQAAA